MTETAPTTSLSRLLDFVSRQPLTVARLFAKSLAFLVNTLHLSKTTQTIQLNIQITLPELNAQQRKQITQHAIRNELTSYFEFFHIWGSSNSKNIQRVHQVHGEALLQDALAAQQGVVLIVPHFGTWEIMNAWLAQYTQMTIMYKPVKNPAADAFVRQARSREQAHLVPTDESGVRQIFKALKQGGTTVILPDHTPNVGGEMIPFFGIPLESSNLSAKLIQKTKAKALFLYALRNENQSFDIYIEAMDEQIYHCNANAGTTLIHRAIEDLIRRHPAHYHWSYKRYKAHPDLRGVYHKPVDQALVDVQTVRAQFKPKLTLQPRCLLTKRLYKHVMLLI